MRISGHLPAFGVWSTEQLTVQKTETEPNQIYINIAGSEPKKYSSKCFRRKDSLKWNVNRSKFVCPTQSQHACGHV